MSETLYASFADPVLAERAVGALLDCGANHADISLVAHEAYHDVRGEVVEDCDEGAEREISSKVWGRSACTNRYDAEDGDEEQDDDDPVEDAFLGLTTTTPSDAAAGALKGAGVGLGVGTLAALASLLIPGYGLVLGGGALAVALAGAAGATAAGAVAGCVTGYLKEQGVPDHKAGEYHEAVHGGGAMIAVRLPSGRLDRATAERLLAEYQASNVGAYARAAE